MTDPIAAGKFGIFCALALGLVVAGICAPHIVIPAVAAVLIVTG